MGGCDAAAPAGSLIGIIGGSGFASLSAYRLQTKREVETPYGDPSAPLQQGQLAGVDVVFLPRHGTGHDIPPHRINYRANVWALHEVGVRRIIAIAAVGGIQKRYAPGSVAIPHQILDYTYGREHTYYDARGVVGHVDFSLPYCEELRSELVDCALQHALPVNTRGTYAATQGPRFESAAEIGRLERDGANLVGMTGMPEAGLAREKGICYATLALVVNYAAGRGHGLITQSDIESAFLAGSETIYALLTAVMPRLATLEFSIPPVFEP